MMTQHPDYIASIDDWIKWRLIMNGGKEYKAAYLIQRTSEIISEFNQRRDFLSPNPAFGTYSLIEVKDQLLLRINSEVRRSGGSQSYQQAIIGKNSGIDLNGASIQNWIATKILLELLFMGKVGVFVDALQDVSPTKDDTHPYYITYKAENIINWTSTQLLLKDSINILDDDGFPASIEERHIFVKQVDNHIEYQYFNASDEQVDKDTHLPSDISYTVNVPEIPFHVFELSHSLFKDVADYQVALLNLASSDTSWIWRSNIPVYTEQSDPRGDLGAYEKRNDDEDPVRLIGDTVGQTYGKGLERPGYIHPSSEPLLAAMQKEDQFKAEIRQLLYLSISSVRSSAESKKFDNEAMEAGFAAIGHELEIGENQLAEFYTLYEQGTPAIAKYPESYENPTNAARLKSAKETADIRKGIPSETAQRELLKKETKILLEREVSDETLNKCIDEIQNAEGLTADPEDIRSDIEVGVLSRELGSKMRFYPEGDVEQAKKEHTERIAAIKAAQSSEPDDLGGDHSEGNNPDNNPEGARNMRGDGNG